MNTTVTSNGNQTGDPEVHRTDRVPATAPAVAGSVR